MLYTFCISYKRRRFEKRSSDVRLEHLTRDEWRVEHANHLTWQRCVCVTADYALMLHQQQGYHWQFEKTMKVRSETMNGSSGPENGDGEVGENKEGADGMEVDVGGTVGASTSTGMAKTVEV